MQILYYKAKIDALELEEKVLKAAVNAVKAVLDAGSTPHNLLILATPQVCLLRLQLIAVSYCTYF